MKEGGKTKGRPIDKPKSKHRQSEQQEEINESLELFEGFASGSPIGLYIVQGGKFRYVNPRFEEILGYSKEELIGTESLNYVHPEDREAVKANAVRILKSGRFTGASPYEYRVTCKSGKTKWIMESIAPIQYKGKQATLGYFMDISKRKLMEYALQQEKAFAESIIATAQVIILVLDKEGHIAEFNPYMEEISGYRLSEVRGDDWFDTFLPESVRTLGRTLFQQAISDIQTKGYINQIVTRDGRELYVEWYDKTLKDTDGTVIGLLAIGHDVTERKKAELQIQESENRFRSLFENMATGVIIQNADGEVTAMNPAAERILGANREQISHPPVIDKNLECIGEDGSPYPALEHPSLITFRTGRPINHAVMGLRSRTDNDYRWIYISTIPHFHPGENMPYQVIITFEDFTEMKKAEEALRKSEQYFRALFEHAGDAMYVLDFEGKHIIDCNKQACADLGYSRQEILQLSASDIEAVLTPEEIIAVHKRLKLEESPIIQSRHRRKDGTTFPVEIRFSLPDPVRSEFLITAVRDITERKKVEEALRIANERLEYLMLSASTVIYSAEVYGNYAATFVAKNVVQLTGYEPKNFFENPVFWYDHVHPDDRPVVDTEVPNLLKKSVHAYEYRFQRKDGEYIWVRDEMKLVRDEKGEPKEIIGCWFDITERKKAEMELQQSRRRLEEVNRLAHIGVWDWDAAVDKVTWSKELYEIAGLDPESPAPTYAEHPKVYTAESFARLSTAIEEALETGKVNQLELELVRPDGSHRWVYAFGGPRYSQNRKIIGLWGTVQDITERKQTEIALQTSEQRLREAQALGKVANYEITKPPDFNVTWSDEMYELFERDRRLPPPTIEEIPSYFSPEEYSKFRALSNMAATEGKEVHQDIIASLPSGKKPVFYISIRPIKDTQGEVVKLFGTVQDITERKRAERLLESSHQELRSLYRRLQNLREEERTQVASALHDELGQAMTAMKMDLSWVAKRLPQNELTLLGKIASMSELTDTVAETMRRISTELRPGLLDDLGLEAAIEWQAEEFAGRAGVKSSCTCSLPDIKINNDMSTTIFRIFQELLTNIGRHARATKIGVSLAKKSGNIELEVTDNGIGISDEAINSNKSFGLIGIRERASAFGGEVMFKGTPGKGTTVTIRIPLQD